MSYHTLIIDHVVSTFLYIPRKFYYIYEEVSKITLTIDHNLVVLVFLSFLLFVLLWYLIMRKFQRKEIKMPYLRSFSGIVPGDDRPRFRKRDKIRYYATRLNRRFQDLTNKLQNIKSKDQKQKLMSLFAKKVLSLKEQGPKLLRRPLPNAFLEPEAFYQDPMLPEEFQLLLDSIRVFGYLEKNFVTELCKNMETIKLQNKDFLFKKGDVDDNVFVVKSGRIKVFIEEKDIRMTIREVQRGGNIYSMLSVLDVIDGQTQIYKTVNAQAMETSEVLRVKAAEFVNIFKKSPETMVRVVQLIAMRLQRVTFLSLHHYLGLTSELICKDNLAVSDSRVLKLAKEFPHLTNQSLIRQLSASLELEQYYDNRENSPTSNWSTKLPQKSGTMTFNQKVDLTNFSPTTKTKNIISDHKRSRSVSPNKTASNVAVNKHADNNPTNTQKSGHNNNNRKHDIARQTTNNPGKPMEVHDILDDDILRLDFEAGNELEYGETPASVRRRASMKERLRKHHTVGPNATTISSGGAGTSKSQQRRNRVQSLVPNIDTQRIRTHKENTDSLSGIPTKDLDGTAPKLTTSDLLNAAKADIGKILGLDDYTPLSKLKISLVPEATSLVREGEEVSDVFFVVTGELNCLQHNISNDQSKMSSLFVTYPGELCGVEPLITTEAIFYTIRALKPARVVVLSRELLYNLIRERPTILLKLSNLLVRRMSPFLRQIDFALEWNNIKAGYPVYNTGDPPKNVYIILSGRFRQIIVKPDGSREIVNELGRGELLGFVEVLCDQKRATTVMAIRDSEVAQIPSGLLSWIKFKAPQVVTRLIQLLADKLMVSMSNTPVDIGRSLTKGPVGTMANLRTIAIVGNSPNVPLEAFTLELQHAMMNLGSTVRLDSRIIVKRLGPKALDPMNEYRLLSWLSQQEDLHTMVFYVADYQSNSTWSKRCIRQADCVVNVALANSDPSVSATEQVMESDQTKVSKVLVLLYPMDTEHPPVGKTSEWLNNRPWCTNHYHVRAPNRVLNSMKRATRKDRLVQLYKRVFEKETPNPHADMSRLARYLTGTAIGLVLGGGGARGCSHVGVIRAMFDSGIPIDIVGGTSIGSFMGALWAEETRITQFTQRARAYCRVMSSVWKMVLDLTYSPVSIFSGKAFNSNLEHVFQDRQIEDLWLPYFAITTDITNSRMRVHTNGSLWRFVRASMSLSGYLPPLCSPEDGSLLLDGGYVNNLPADVMQSFGPEQIFAVDVGSNDDTDLSNYGDWLSGGKLFYKKMSRDPLKVLNLTEIQSRLAYVSCVRQMEQLKETNICEYMRPPIEKFKTLQFGSFDEIQEVGYDYTKKKIAEWQANETLKHFTRGQLFYMNEMGEYISAKSNKLARIKYNGKNASLISSGQDVYKKNFIDLAELVARIDPTQNSYYESENDEEDNLAKIKMEDEETSAEVEILFRPRQQSKKPINSPTNMLARNALDKEDHCQININSTSKFDEGYDEDLEEEDPIIECASDPESFNRVLVHSHKKRHRRSSLNRLHKSVTFGGASDLG